MLLGEVRRVLLATAAYNSVSCTNSTYSTAVSVTGICPLTVLPKNSRTNFSKSNLDHEVFGNYWAISNLKVENYRGDHRITIRPQDYLEFNQPSEPLLTIRL